VKKVRSRILTALLVHGLCISVPPVGAQTLTVDAVDSLSSLTYHLSHPLHHIESTSKAVRYRLTLDTARHEVRTVVALVNVMSFNSGNSNRDSHAGEVIDALTYPNAVFAGSSITQSGDSISVTGKLTFHGVTRDVTMAGTTAWSPGMLVVRGGFSLSLTDYKIDRPSLLMIPVGDTLTIDLDAAFALK
jgi:polyisoprenoid-binding protein YceI